MKKRFDLSGKVAVVIGGAGGIGGAIATGFVEHGARLVMASRNIENLKLRAAAIGRETGGEATAMGVDITDEEDVIRLVGEIVARYGTVDILVNAHGANKKAKGLDLSMEDWQLLHNVNSMGTMISCKQFGRIMTKRRSGKVINLSSVRGIRANAGGNSAYCSTKGAVDMITRCLAAEWAPFNVNVNAIGPALIATKLTEKQMKEPGRTEKYLRNIPLGRLGKAEDMVGAAIFLASAASDFVTGQIIYVDGGLTAIG
ncbi:MAG: glucose 1-dehydrogenase [Firmicutes bacterium]|nr:glucose 1-dehydrogenase [Bacillota bacterium]